jgi:hypothetical protein
MPRFTLLFFFLFLLMAQQTVFASPLPAANDVNSVTDVIEQSNEDQNFTTQSAWWWARWW